MPSDTAWVAIVGGSVTVASLAVQGWFARSAEKRRYEQEDRQRVEDRAWQFKQENREQRRELYVDLLRALDRLDFGLDQLAWMHEDEPNRGDTSEYRVDLETDEDRLNSAVANVEVQALDDELVELARTMREAAESGLTRSLLDDPSAGVREERAKLHDALPKLRRAIRRDLYGDVSSTDAPTEP